MAIIKAINSKASIAKGINYITKEEKTEEKLVSGVNCNPETAIDEMKVTKELYDKDTGRQYYHFIQSFNPIDKVKPDMAHKLGKEWLKRNEKFQGYEVVLATHKDKDHTHNHFIINSVNFETGMKLHTNKKEYQNMKDISNQISLENGLTIPRKSQEKGKVTSFNQNKYQAMKRHVEGNYKSYVLDTAIVVKETQEIAISKDDFIKKLQEKGYDTKWKDTRKHVTFTNIETKTRVRLANLEKTFNDESFSKGGLTDEFERNKSQREISREENERDKQPKQTGIRKQPSQGEFNRIYKPIREVEEGTKRLSGRGREEIRERERKERERLERLAREKRERAEKTIQHSDKSKQKQRTTVRKTRGYDRGMER